MVWFPTILKIQVLWNVTVSLVEQFLIFWRSYVPSKCEKLLTEWQGVTPRKIRTFKNTAVRISDLALNELHWNCDPSHEYCTLHRYMLYSSVDCKFTEAHDISLFHLPAAPCTGSRSSDSQSCSTETIYRVNFHKWMVKTGTANVSWCPWFCYIIYIYIYTT